MNADLQRLPAIAQRTRLLLLAGLTTITVAVMMVIPRIPQDPAYHDFADQRELLGIPNALNVLSNLPFLLFGIFGLMQAAAPRPNSFISPHERWPYLMFFSGVTLTFFGSAYYHLAPNNAHLVWDRLPMSIAFMALLSAVIVERISRRAGLIFLAPLVAAGVSSVAYWHFTEQQNRGDLRPYVLVQFYSMLVIAAIVLLFRSRYTHGHYFLIAGGCYILAKLAELLDGQIMSAVRIISGHSFKHLIAGVATLWVIRMLMLRTPQEP